MIGAIFLISILSLLVILYFLSRLSIDVYNQYIEDRLFRIMIMTFITIIILSAGLLAWNG